MDVRRSVISASEYVMPVAQRRALAIERGELWIVNIAYATSVYAAYGGHAPTSPDDRKAFVTIQPFSTEAEKESMREAFISQRDSRENVLPAMEMLGNLDDVKRNVLTLIRACEITIRILPRDVWAVEHYPPRA